jgi:phage tail sheath gpL-like
MSIAFNEVPANARTPFVFIEFDNSRAVQSLGSQPYTVLVVGQKTAAGTSPELTIENIINASQAGEKFGFDSQMYHMIKAYRDVDSLTPMVAVSIDDLGAGVNAIKTVTVPTATATDAGVLALYVGGRRYQVGVASADDQDAVALSIIAAVNADSSAVVTAAAGAASNVVNLTAKNKGTVGNQIDVRTNYNDTDALPPGIVQPTFAVLTAGSGDPDVQEILDVIPDDHYNFVVFPWTDSANLNAIRTEAEERNGPTKQVEMMGVTSNADTVGNQTTLGESRNDRFLTIMDVTGPDMPLRWSAAYTARMVQSAQLDPARPFQTLSLPGIGAPEKGEERVFEERNMLLFDGIATHKVDSGGVVRIERAITTYRQNPQGADDVSYLDVNTYTTLSFIRYDFRNSFLLKYPRHKLADDGNNFASGQPVMTPKVGRGFAVNKFQQWNEVAYVENIEQFIQDLLVERNVSDRNRLDFLVSPDLINQMRIAGVQIAFLL